MALTHENRIALWDVINRYVAACGGKTGRNNVVVRGNIAAEVEKVVEDIVYQEDCQCCQGYQEEELGAGLRSGCITDELYEDEDGQIIKDDVNDIVTAFMLGKRDKCPYFKRVNLDIM